MTGGTDRDFGEADRRSEKAPRCVSCAHSAEVATDGGWNLEGLVKYHVLSKESERTLAEKHIVVCPFCEVGHPIPKDFDAIHRCICGACYKVCANDLLDAGVSDIADELWTDGELDFIRSVPIDFCNVIVEKDFDRLLDLKQNLDPLGIERFCKYDLGVHLSLVWVKRLF
jgi:hypothetical protein